MANLREIDDEIKKIEALKRATLNQLEVEKSLNNTIMYSVNSRRKYTDALSAAATSQKDYMAKEEQLTQVIKTSYVGLERTVKKFNAQVKAKKALSAVTKTLSKDTKKNNAEIKKNNIQLKKLQQEIAGSDAAVKGYRKTLTGAVDEVNAFKGSAKKLQSTFKDLADLDKVKFSSFEELNNLTKQRTSLLKKQLDIQVQSGKMDKDNAEELKAELGDVESMHAMKGDDIKKKLPRKLSPMVDELTGKAAGEVDQKKASKNAGKEAGRSLHVAEAKKAVGLKGDQIANLKAIFSTKTGFSEKMGAVKSHKGSSEELGKLNKVMAATGKGALGPINMLKNLGTALGSLGKLGWIGLLISAVSAVANVVNDLDKFLKSFNKTFKKLQGPTVAMGDIDKAMTAFTNSIFDMQRNMKLGLKSEDIVGMFQSISESGMSLQGVLSKVQGGYGGMIDKASKVSFDFGVSMEEAGSMLGEQMVDLKSSVDDAAESFKVLSYDASIAGIQSQKFYQATYAAAEAVSYYGKFLTTASGILKNFQQQGGMGFKDAAKSTQELTGLFSNMDLTTRVAFMNLTGGVDEYTKVFSKGLEKVNKDLENHQKTLEGKKKDLGNAKSSEEVDSIKSAISAEEEQITALKRLQVINKEGLENSKKGRLQDAAASLGAVSDQIMPLLGNLSKTMMKDAGLDIFSGDQAAISIYLKTTAGMSEDLAQTFMTTAKMYKGQVESMALSMKDTVSTLDDKQRKGISDILQKYSAKGSYDIKELKNELSDYGTKGGIHLDMGKIADDFSKLPSTVTKVLVDGYEKTKNASSDLATADLNPTQVVINSSDEDQAKRMTQIAKSSTTIEEFLGIASENMKYLVAKSDPQKLLVNAAVSTAQSAGVILKFVEKIAGIIPGGVKSREDFKKDVNYKSFEKEVNRGLLLQTERDKITGTDGDSVAKRKKLDKKIEKNEAWKRASAGKNIFQQTDFAQSSVDYAKEVYDTKAKYEDKIAFLQKKNETASKTDAAANNKAILDLTKDGNKALKKLTDVDDIKIEVKPVVSPAPALAPTENVKQNKDYKAASGGYALLSKGDVVVNAKSMSAGVGGDLGAFAGTAASEMMKSIGSKGAIGSQAPNIPVQINIGSVSGDPNEFLRSIRPAIEQAFERMYFDKQKRR